METLKIVLRNLLRDERLRHIFVKRCSLKNENLVVEDLIRLKDVENTMIHTFLDEYLDFTYEYPHPINPSAQVMNPIKLVGVKGAYLVVEDYQEIKSKFTFFTNKKLALQHADHAYKYFLKNTHLVDRAKGLKPYRN